MTGRVTLDLSLLAGRNEPAQSLNRMTAYTLLRALKEVMIAKEAGGPAKDVTYNLQLITCTL